MDTPLEAVGKELAAGNVERHRRVLDIYKPSAETGPDVPPAWS